MYKSHSENHKCPNVKSFGSDKGFAVLTVPYFSPDCLAGFNADCDRGLEQVLYLHALIEDDNAQAVAQHSTAAG